MFKVDEHNFITTKINGRNIIEIPVNLIALSKELELNNKGKRVINGYMDEDRVPYGVPYMRDFVFCYSTYKSSIFDNRAVIGIGDKAYNILSNVYIESSFPIMKDNGIIKEVNNAMLIREIDEYLNKGWEGIELLGKTILNKSYSGSLLIDVDFKHNGLFICPGFSSEWGEPDLIRGVAPIILYCMDRRNFVGNYVSYLFDLKMNKEDLVIFKKRG